MGALIGSLLGPNHRIPHQCVHILLWPIPLSFRPILQTRYCGVPLPVYSANNRVNDLCVVVKTGIDWAPPGEQISVPSAKICKPGQRNRFNGSAEGGRGVWKLLLPGREHIGLLKIKHGAKKEERHLCIF